jgi:ribonucleoside-diphosphate reductase alpha chain
MTYVERIVERIIERPMRRRLPETRSSLTHRFNVAGHEGYLTVGLYDNGGPGELFITMSKEGSTIGGLMDSLGTAISVALQYGVPIESLVNKFAHQRFEPMGMTANRDIPFAKSLVDYIFRWMGMEFIPGYREANAPARTESAKKPEARVSGGSVKEDKRWSDRSPGTAGAAGKPGVDEVGERGRGVPARIVEAPAKHPGAGNGSASGGGSSASMTGDTASGVTVAHALDHSNAAMQSDAPACDVCGAITVRNGTCYKCLNCGNSMGCS